MIRWFLDNVFLHTSPPPERDVEHCMTQRLADEIEWLARDRDDWKEIARKALQERDVALAQRDAARKQLNKRVVDDR